MRNHPAVWGALLQEGVDVAVILNALRPVAAAPLAPADAALTQRFRAEHQVIRGDIEQLRTAADTLTTDMLAAPRRDGPGPPGVPVARRRRETVGGGRP